MRLNRFTPTVRGVDIALQHGATPGPGDKSHDPDGLHWRRGSCLVGRPRMAADFSAELDFVTRASNSNLFAMEESRLAIDRTGDPKVKTFTPRMVEDHGSAEAELKAASEGSGAAVPTSLDEEHQARLTALRGRSGADFDKAYVADQGETTPMLSPSMATTCCGASMRSFTPWRSRGFRSRKRSSRTPGSSPGTDKAAPTLADARSFRYPRRAGR